MIKTIQTTLLGLLTIGLMGLASCSRDKKQPLEPQNEGTTYVNVSISMTSDGVRAGEEDFNMKGTWNGKDAIESVSVYIVDASSVSWGSYSVGDFTVTKATDTQNISIVPNKAILTTAGDKMVYVLLNAPQEIQSYLKKSIPNEFTKAYHTAISVITAREAAYANTSKEDIILMTNATDCALTVEDGVSEEQAMAAKNPKNHAQVSVKRAVARVLLTTTATTYDVNYSDGTKMGTVSDITYAVAQGEKAFYLTQLTESNVIKTPAYSFVPEVDATHPEKLVADSYSKMAEYYDYSDLHTTPGRAALEATSLADALAIGKKSLESSAFMFEASHKFASQTGMTVFNYDGDFRRANTPYVLVRAKFAPAKLADTDEAYVAGTTFYKGENGLFYKEINNVVTPAKGGVAGQKCYTYKDGKVLYYAFVNPDNIAKTLDAPVYRNNIYHISVTGFKTIGLNWNPLYPEDPDSTDPKNPDPKPQGDPVPPIIPGDHNTPKETYMAVDIAVIPWNVHTYEINLGI